MFRFAELSLFAITCLALSGCGNGLAQVSGQVLLDGQPLGKSDTVRVTVQFQPANKAGSTAIGLADENGYYQLATGSRVGIPPGDYFVTCSAGELFTRKLVNGTSIARQITDPKYANAKTSGLKFTVEPGKNQYDIRLQSSTKMEARIGS